MTFRTILSTTSAIIVSAGMLAIAVCPIVWIFSIPAACATFAAAAVVSLVGCIGLATGEF
jgi:hypothetical protein